MEVLLYKLLTLGINDGDNEQHMTLKGLPGMLGPFFIYPNHTGKVSSDERRHYICNTFSHWMMKQFSQWLCPFSKTTQIENWTGIVAIYMMTVVVMMVIMMTTTTTMMMMRGGGGGGEGRGEGREEEKEDEDEEGRIISMYIHIWLMQQDVHLSTDWYNWTYSPTSDCSIVTTIYAPHRRWTDILKQRWKWIDQIN